jgi:carbon monoxide dehydrogenase subunit G
MRLEHEFTVPVPADQAWHILLDIERIAPCLPGAVIDSVTDDGFSGRVKVKVGPITVSYAGEGRFVEADQAAGHVLIEARGKETRGSGTAKATIEARLHGSGSTTRVSVVTDLAITGKPAQFGRGVMVDVGGKLLEQFAACLAERLGETEAESAGPPVPVGEAAQAAPPAPTTSSAPAAPTVTPAATPGPVPTAPPGQAALPRRTAPRAEPVPIDLLGTATGPVLKRLAPVAAGAVLLALLWWLGRRMRR